MPLHRRPNPTDPGDAADLSTPQGICLDRWLWLGATVATGPVAQTLSERCPKATESGRCTRETSRLRELVTLRRAVNGGQAASATTRLGPSRLAR